MIPAAANIPGNATRYPDDDAARMTNAALMLPAIIQAAPAAPAAAPAAPTRRPGR